MNRFKKNILHFSIVIAGILLVQACDTTSADADNDEHQEPEGFVLVERGNENVEILRFENGIYTWNPDGAYGDYFRDGINGIVISPDVISTEDVSQDPNDGEPAISGMTPKLLVRWIDHDGDIFDLPDTPEEEGGEYWLRWVWEKPNTSNGGCEEDDRNDPDTIDLIRPANLEQHDSDGLWGFHFRADHAGSDQLTFSLMHGQGQAAHPDFTVEPLTVVVPNDDHEIIDEDGIYHHTRDKCRTR